MLGTFAGDVTLTFGARGGVYIMGGIVPKIYEIFRHSHFRERFNWARPLPPIFVHRPDLCGGASLSRPFWD